MAPTCSARFCSAFCATLVALVWIVCCFTPAPAGATGAACVHEVTSAGTTVTTSGDPGFVEPHQPAGAPANEPDSRDYIWRSTHAGWIGSSTAISLIPGREDVMEGYNNAPPTLVEFYDAAGTGVPYLTAPAQEAQIAARDGVYAEADLVGGGITLTGWYLDLGTPAWTVTLPGASFGDSDNTLQVNIDATRVLFGYFQGGQVWLLVIDAATGDKLVQTVITLNPPSLRGLACSDDGRYVVLNCGATHVVYDADLNVERGRISTGASTEPTAISETGEWVAAGFTSCKAWQWDPGTQTYVLRWNRTTASHYLGVNMISERGYWIVGWYSSSYNQNRIQRWSLDAGALVWTIDLPVSSGAVQDLPVSIDFNRSRSVIAIGCWGDTQPVSPEILAFTPDGEELASLHAPGSMFDVAVSTDGRYVSATGKLVHANIMGNGADVYCMYSGDLAAVGFGESRLADPVVRLTASPNPCRGATLLRAGGPEAAGGIVRIVDGSGRLVSTLSLGPGGVAWDGRDHLGQAAAAGMYFATLSTPHGLVRTPLLLVR
jgi:hypothetical protein